MFASAVRNAIAGPSRLRQTALPQFPQQPLRPTLPLTLAAQRMRTNPSPFPTDLSSLRLFSSSATQADKLKSHSGTKKRFFRTASGLFKRAQAGKRHLNTLFSASRINRLGKTKYTTKTQNTMLKKLLPYA